MLEARTGDVVCTGEAPRICLGRSYTRFGPGLRSRITPYTEALESIGIEPPAQFRQDAVHASDGVVPVDLADVTSGEDRLLGSVLGAYYDDRCEMRPGSDFQRAFDNSVYWLAEAAGSATYVGSEGVALGHRAGNARPEGRSRPQGLRRAGRLPWLSARSPWPSPYAAGFCTGWPPRPSSRAACGPWCRRTGMTCLGPGRRAGHAVAAGGPVHRRAARLPGHGGRPVRKDRPRSREAPTARDRRGRRPRVRRRAVRSRGESRHGLPQHRPARPSPSSAPSS